MITGAYAQCLSCEHQYRVRYNVGHNFPQKGTFKCKTCGSNLEYGYTKDRKTYSNGLKLDGDEPATVQNLHPEIAIDPDRENDPYYFPSPEYVVNYHVLQNGDMITFRNAQRSLQSFKNQLDQVINPLRYLKEGRWSMLEVKYGKNQEKAKKLVLKDCIKVGRQFVEGEWHQIYRSVLGEAERSKKKEKFPELKAYLASRSKEFLIDRMYEVFHIYNDVYHELLPTLLSQKIGMDYSGNSSGANWLKIEMVYGSFYEVYGDLLVIPTAINNLLTRGNHEVFEHFTFEGYLESDKANRFNNFLTNENMNKLSQFYDSGIRNATHHKASTANKEDQEITLRTGKGGKTQRIISLVEYVAACNEIFARILILMNINYKLLN